MFMFHFLTTDAASGLGTSAIMMVGMLALMYFMLIRPENKRKKESEEMRSSVKKGDKVTTIGGIIGTVVDVKENNVVIETSADQVRMELAKWALSSNETAAEAAKASYDAAKESLEQAEDDYYEKIKNGVQTQVGTQPGQDTPQGNTPQQNVGGNVPGAGVTDTGNTTGNTEEENNTGNTSNDPFAEDMMDAFMGSK